MEDTKQDETDELTSTNRIAALIKQASEKAGSSYKLAKLIHRTDSEVSQWKTGKKTCPVQAQAMMAEIAGLNAPEVALYAVIESEKDPKRKEVLARVLGKGLMHTIAAVSGGIFASVIWGSDAYAAGTGYFIRCIEKLNRRQPLGAA